MHPQTGLGIVAERYRWPGGGVLQNFCASALLRLYLGQNAIFRQKKTKKKSAQKWSENGPKVVNNGQNCPKIGEIIGGGPPENPNESQKWVLTLQERYTFF